MRFLGIRLVQQTEQKFRCIRECLEEKNVIDGLFYSKSTDKKDSRQLFLL